MKKVITYGTYDLLHYGHIRLLERAKALGDYLIVGVTADDFDKTRGKINVRQSLMERIEAVRETGLADEIIVEEYEGQKIDDIRRYHVDIFTIGSDWYGKFDYLKEYCEVVYLERTEGISSSEIRDRESSLSLGLVGDSAFLNKVAAECSYVNGIHVSGICTDNIGMMSESIRALPVITGQYEELLDNVEAVYIRSQPTEHYAQIRLALERGKHVICESPMVLSREECGELQQLAKEKNLILMEAIKTAYATAYSRLLLLIKSGNIGRVVSVDATCTSIREIDVDDPEDVKRTWDGIHEWGPTGLLPVFQILGTEYTDRRTVVRFRDREQKHDSFVKTDFLYADAVASVKTGNGVKSEGELIISGTKGYVYVPAPWWKTDYFEVRYENPAENRRYFYQLDGEGIRYELAAFARAAEKRKDTSNIAPAVTREIAGVMEDFRNRKNLCVIE
jgi:choline-phosphate cytidylyltransferase